MLELMLYIILNSKYNACNPPKMIMRQWMNESHLSLRPPTSEYSYEERIRSSCFLLGVGFRNFSILPEIPLVSPFPSPLASIHNRLFTPRNHRVPNINPSFPSPRENLQTYPRTHPLSLPPPDTNVSIHRIPALQHRTKSSAITSTLSPALNPQNSHPPESPRPSRTRSPRWPGRRPGR